ncbi:MAG: flagellar basal body rod protein FlgC [Phycisphaerales bacterium]
MYGALDISTSGMTAQRARIEAIAANIANKDAILDSGGELSPYRARRVFFAPGDPSAKTAAGRALGVHVSRIELDQSPVSWKHDPDNPYAAKSGPRAGYVPEPSVDPVFEQINAMEAARAYEANVVAAEATKAMTAQALRLLA